MHQEPSPILFTPDDSDRLFELSRLSGFIPEIRDFSSLEESFPDQSQLLDDFDMSVLYKKIDLDYGRLSKEHFEAASNSNRNFSICFILSAHLLTHTTGLIYDKTVFLAIFKK